MAKSTAVAGDPSQLRALQNSVLPMRRECIEFEPQNLGIVSIDSGGQIVEANEAFLSMSGYSLADLPLDMATITPAEWHELDDSKGRQFADNGHCLPWQKQILTRQGDLLPIVIGAAALNPTADRFQYFIANTESLLRADNVILDYQSRLRSAAVELSLSAERERRTIAEELHDNIGQELAIAKLKFSNLRTEMNGKIRAELDDIAVHITNALGSCRNLSHTLATPSLYKLGLVPAIKNLVASLNRNQRLRISLRFDDEEIFLPSTTKIILYRVIRELLINVFKHAQASSVEISGSRVGEMFRIVIADDGIGCDFAKTPIGASSEQGLGLFLVRERLWHIGGSFELESAAGKGTSATLEVPREDIKDQVGPSG